MIVIRMTVCFHRIISLAMLFVFLFLLLCDSMFFRLMALAALFVFLFDLVFHFSSIMGCCSSFYLILCFHMNEGDDNQNVCAIPVLLFFCCLSSLCFVDVWCFVIHSIFIINVLCIFFIITFCSHVIFYYHL